MGRDVGRNQVISKTTKLWQQNVPLIVTLVMKETTAWPATRA